MKNTPSEEPAPQHVDFESALLKEAALMKAAQRFSIAMDGDRQFKSNEDRLDFMLATWRALALAALEYAKSA